MSNTITGMMHATETITAESWKGIKGDKGDTGATGYSPTATVTQTDTGATVTITDAKGTTTADIANGSDASVTTDNIVAALGYTPERDRSGQWYTLYSTQLTEGVNAVTIDRDNDGNTFSVDGIMISLSMPYPQASDALNIRIDNAKKWEVFNKTMKIQGQTEGNSSATTYKEQYHSTFVFRIVPLNGLLYAQFSVGMQGQDKQVYEPSNTTNVFVALQKMCSIQMKVYHAGKVLEAGTDITVYALRA